MPAVASQASVPLHASQKGVTKDRLSHNRAERAGSVYHMLHAMVHKGEDEKQPRTV